MSSLNTFVELANQAAKSARDVSAADVTAVDRVAIEELLTAIEKVTGGAALILGQLQNDAYVAAGEVPPLEELTRLLTQAAHRARIHRNRGQFRT